jgi:hypothetical protein
MMKKVSAALVLFLFCTVLSFGGNFILHGKIINESDETIYCTSRVKEDIKEILEFDEIISKKNEELYLGLVPFYWHGNYIVDIKGVGVQECTEIRIPNAIIEIDRNTVIRNDLILFQVGSAMKADFSAPPGEWITNYYMKSIQLLDYFFSEIIVCDGEGNIFLTLEDLREYYDGLEDEEIGKNLTSAELKEYFKDYLIIVTQEMIDNGRRKHDTKKTIIIRKGVGFRSEFGGASLSKWEHNEDNDHVADLTGTAGNGKVAIKWKVAYTEDNDDSTSRKEMAEKGYTLPEYHFVAEYDGVESEPGPIVKIHKNIFRKRRQNKWLRIP